jgi:16S rRNA (guanine966-N2)-methyltransferase
MEILSGEHRGRRLKVPKGLGVRPVSRRARLAMFSILGGRCDGLRVLDLFAGTGSLGLECVSRGAARAVFVERAPGALKCLSANVEAMNAGGRCVVLAGDVFSVVRDLASRSEDFDLVLLDPPYRKGLVMPAIEAAGVVLARGGTVVACHSPAEPVPDAVRDLATIDRRRYGETALAFLRRAGGLDQR